MIKPAFCAFGDDETRPREVMKFLEEGVGLRFPKEPSEIHKDDNLEDLFEKLVAPKDLIFLAYEKSFSDSELGGKFLRLMSLVKVTREDKKIFLIKLDSSKAPLDLELLPKVQYSDSDDAWKSDLSGILKPYIN